MELKPLPKTTTALDQLPSEAIAAVRNAPLLERPVDRFDQQQAIVPQKHISNPIPPEGTDGLFTQSWFPICLASDVATGTVKGYDFLDGRVIVWRGRDGVARVMSAFCPHMGASLEAGAVVDDRVRCGFHHWEYGGDGTCAKTAIGDAAPSHACLFVFPSLERWGIVWAFNGETPLYELPTFPFPSESLLVKTIELPMLMPVDPWVQCANTPDIQHIKTLHRIRFDDDPYELVKWDLFSMQYEFTGFFESGTQARWHVGVWGTSLYYQSAYLEGRWFGFMTPMGLPRPGHAKNFMVIAAQATADRAADEAFIDLCMLTEMGIVGEDTHVMTTMRFRPGTLTRSDRVLGRYFNYLRDYPRAHPSAPYIK